MLCAAGALIRHPGDLPLDRVKFDRHLGLSVDRVRARQDAPQGLHPFAHARQPDPLAAMGRQPAPVVPDRNGQAPFASVLG